MHCAPQLLFYVAYCTEAHEMEWQCYIYDDMLNYVIVHFIYLIFFRFLHFVCRIIHIAVLGKNSTPKDNMIMAFYQK